MRRIASLLLIALSAATLVACDSDPTATARTPPTDPGAVVFRIDSRGGFTSIEAQLAIVPQLTVFADGHVVVVGPTTEQYPPHALPTLLAGRLDHDQIARLVDRAADADLHHEHDYGHPSVTDLPTTTVTVRTCRDRAKCAAVRQRAYALDWPVRGDDPGLTDTQARARRELRAFVRDLTRTARPVATRPYVASRVAVYAGPAAVEDFAPTGCCPGVIDWPLGDLGPRGSPIDPVDFRCSVVSGADAATALAAAAPASIATRWRSAADIFTVVIRPLLPDEHGCPAGP